MWQRRRDEALHFIALAVTLLTVRSRCASTGVVTSAWAAGALS